MATKLLPDVAGYRVIPNKTLKSDLLDVRRKKNQQKKVDNLWQRDSFDSSVIDRYHATRGRLV